MSPYSKTLYSYANAYNNKVIISTRMSILPDLHWWSGNNNLLRIILSGKKVIVNGKQ